MRISMLWQLCGRLTSAVYKSNSRRPTTLLPNRSVRTSVNCFSKSGADGTSKKDEEEDEEFDEEIIGRKERRISTETYFNTKRKNEKTFNSMIDIYRSRNANRRGHVEFILAAMNHLEEFNVDFDLKTYKNLISILPEDKYVPENVWQLEFMHFPRQQECIISVLEKMESKGICPDEDLKGMLIRRFGKYGHPVRKCGRMMYWMPKMKNASPWPVPNPPPKENFTLAKMAIERIVTVDPQSEVEIYQTEALADAIDHTYIISGQSPTQRRLIQKQPRDKPIYVEGAFRIWLRSASINYFILRTDPDQTERELDDPDDVTNLKSPILNFKSPKSLITEPSVHEQCDGTILAVCATGTSSRDSLLSWVRLLEQNGNPSLADVPILFTLKSPLGDVIPVNDGPIPPPTESADRHISAD